MITTAKGLGTPWRSAPPRPERMLPPGRHVLLVVAHPDDETFGLGAVAARLVAAPTTP